MMKKGISVKRKHNKMKHVLCRILVDSHGARFYRWNLGRITKRKDHLVWVLLDSGSDLACRENMAMEDRPSCGKGFSVVKKISLGGSKLHRRSVTKLLKTPPKRGPAVPLTLGIQGKAMQKNSISLVGYCTDQLPEVTSILVETAFRLNPGHELSFNKKGNKPVKAKLYRFLNFEKLNDHRQEVLPKSISVIRRELPKSTLGWPLLRENNRSSPKILTVPNEREVSVVEWVMNLPSRSVFDIKRNHNETNISVDQESDSSDYLLSRNESKAGWPLLRIAAPQTTDTSEISKNTESIQSHPISLDSINNSKDRIDENHLTILNSCNSKQFSYGMLETATCQFSSENLIGEGGCSNVYKGWLPGRKPVAVKILKSYKDAWDDFSLETEIMSSLNHKHITPLAGICVEDNNLVLVYDYLPKGSLEEMLHGSGKKCVLPWEMRFKVAVSIAEALDYLHNECLQPVIHRDVKPSNILLSAKLEPQLSDFGLAIWGPTDLTYRIQEDVAGTFGYIAPEYFMHGRVSDKIDIYSFGVVLLELLSGRRPIYIENEKGVEESLVKWAKLLFESGDIEILFDPNLGNDYDIDQMERMLLVTKLCLHWRPRHRPKASQILELLRGEKNIEEWLNSYNLEEKRTSDQEDYDLFVSCDKRNLDFSFLYRKVEDGSIESISTCSSEHKQHFMLKDYFKYQE